VVLEVCRVNLADRCDPTVNVQTDVTMRGVGARVSEDPSNTQQRLRIEDICNNPTVTGCDSAAVSVLRLIVVLCAFQTAKREVQEVANVLLKWNSFVSRLAVIEVCFVWEQYSTLVTLRTTVATSVPALRGLGTLGD
jgi:hypothetical protein